MIIVLETGGKNEDAYLVRVKFFDTKVCAKNYCEYVNTNFDFKKYLYRAEIAEESQTYELTDEGLYKHNNRPD